MKTRGAALFWAVLFLPAWLTTYASSGGGGKEDPAGNGRPEPGPTVAYRVHGLDFSPYMTGQSPDRGSSIGEEQIRGRLKRIAPYTRWIRSFSSTHGLEKIGPIAREFGLRTAIGAWLGGNLQDNETEVGNLIRAARGGHVDLAVIGSEVLLRGDLTEDQLIRYIERFRREVPAVPVTTADVYSELLAHPRVVEASDIVFVNYYPFWEGEGVKEAVARLRSLHQLVTARYGGKEIVISETGWPSAGQRVGDAEPSPENAARYFQSFLSWARALSVKYFYFEAYDEDWKVKEGTVGPHWGIRDKDGVMKPAMKAVFDGVTANTRHKRGR